MKHDIDDRTKCCGKSFIGDTDICRRCEKIAEVVEKMSDCCNAPIMEDSDVCSSCKEHAGVME